MRTIRVKYIKGDAVRFVSHLETIKVFQRALRRTTLKPSYSQGFHIQMHLIFALPLPVNVLSDGEYADLFFDEDYEVNDVLSLLQPEMPKGFDIVDGGIRTISKHIMTDIKYADYEIKINNSLSLEDIINKLKNRDHIEMKKVKKKRIKIIDLKPMILNLEIKDDALLLKCTAGSASNLHPRLLVEAIKEYIDSEVSEISIKRLELYVDRGGQLIPPLDQKALNGE